jgi:hypothetical protein
MLRQWLLNIAKSVEVQICIGACPPNPCINKRKMRWERGVKVLTEKVHTYLITQLNEKMKV